MLVHQASRHQPEHLALARRQALVPILDAREHRHLLPSRAIARQGLVDCHEHGGLVEWLREKGDRASLHPPHCHRHIAEAADEYDRHDGCVLPELFSYQALLIPATDASVDTTSYHEFASGFFLARAFMKYGWDLYAPDAKTRDNPYVSPLRASYDELKGLPPALVVTAENDPLRDEGEAYAHRLMQSGVEVSAVRFGGTIHDFVALNALRNVPTTIDALKQISDGIRNHIGR
ncbi:alpha/beta hydrolase fold domain-containing protein [Rhizobium bangladeshense]|nr:alpha/beta hydrolase fold domain-containing protein [Rhizobium bangladeshense]TLX11139.1 alpha/beta hydrolase [Rhizobium sp. MHM7A]